MNVPGTLDALLAAQAAGGAFASFVHLPQATLLDCNAFVTALVLRTLRRPLTEAGPGCAWELVRERALDFLESCESAAEPGSFRFWPHDATPAWIGGIPEDADDTAICALELVRHGRRPADFLRQVACKVLLKRRLREVEPPAPEWLRRGVFVTWLRDDPRANLVDCCVNANVVALFAAANMRHLPGYAEACGMIAQAITWVGGSMPRAKCITPFYPHPAELYYAVEHAVECGAAELSASLALVRDWDSCAAAGDPENRPVCSSAYGGVYWTAPVLQAARGFSSARKPTPVTIDLAGETARPPLHDQSQIVETPGRD